MLNPEYWREYRLMVTISNRVANTSYLLDGVPQEEFFETYIDQFSADRRDNVAIIKMDVVILSEDSFEKLAEYWRDDRVLRG